MKNEPKAQRIPKFYKVAETVMNPLFSTIDDAPAVLTRHK